jgi:transposase
MICRFAKSKALRPMPATTFGQRELSDLPDRLSRNHLVALAEIAPFNKDSGKFSGKRSISGGRAKFRCLLFMVAKTAHGSTRSSDLMSKASPANAPLTAAMRKLLIHVQSLLKTREFSPC